MYNFRHSWVGEDDVLMLLRRVALRSLGGIVAVALAACVYASGQTKTGPVDPGGRGGPAGAGTPPQGLTPDEPTCFQNGLARLSAVGGLTQSANKGLRPTLHTNPCIHC